MVKMVKRMKQRVHGMENEEVQNKSETLVTTDSPDDFAYEGLTSLSGTEAAPWSVDEDDALTKSSVSSARDGGDENDKSYVSMDSPDDL